MRLCILVLSLVQASPVRDSFTTALTPAAGCRTAGAISGSIFSSDCQKKSTYHTNNPGFSHLPKTRKRPIRLIKWVRKSRHHRIPNSSSRRAQ